MMSNPHLIVRLGFVDWDSWTTYIFDQKYCNILKIAAKRYSVEKKFYISWSLYILKGLIFFTRSQNGAQKVNNKQS